MIFVHFAAELVSKVFCKVVALVVLQCNYFTDTLSELVSLDPQEDSGEGIRRVWSCNS